MDYQSLIETHASALRAHMHYIHSINNARTDVATREVFIPRPKTRVEYWTAMHELGHVATTASMFMPSDQEIAETEATAWAWALDSSDIPTENDEDLKASIASGFGSYLVGSGPVDTEDVRRVMAIVGPAPSLDWWSNLPFDFAPLEAMSTSWAWKGEWNFLNGK